MEMDSSRRSFDRSREPGLKKPRLATDEPRQFPNRSIGSGLTQAQSRFDGDDPSGGGGGYQPQPLPPHQQHRELLEQYRTALSELTFNSKPIITNLTIIAGENQHAAKAIASAICAHILEVPSDQKLPSLYLLDSIVKNIGRDYIKHFAVKLPEVFCKAYKQVEPPVHSSMRHLFGTWKGVFHPQMLQMIEKELGFGSSANGSSATATSRSESQTQRPPHSIHVNPKYLERQRLQQSATTKGTTSDMDKDKPRLNSSEDIERLERPTGITGARPWPVPSAKMQRSLRDPRIVPPQNKKNTGAVYGDLEYGPEISRNSGLGPGRGGIKATEQKPWYGDDDGGIDDTVPKQRNGFPAKNKLQGYPPPKSSSIDSQLTRSGGGMSASWKNSEEEEFSWDSMDSRLTERDAAINIAIPRKDEWTTDGSEKLDFENNFPKMFSREEQNPAGLLGTPSHMALSDEYLATVSRPPNRGSSLSRIGVGSQVRSSSTGTSGQQRIRSLGLQSPSAQSPMRQHSPPIDLARHSQGDAKTAKFSVDSSLGLTSRYGDNSFSSLSSVRPGNLKRSQPYESKEASPPVAPFQTKQLPHISQQVSAQVSGRPSSIRDSSPENSTLVSSTACQLSASTSSLLAALAKSGGISAMITGMPRLSSQVDGIQASQVNLEAFPSDPQSSELPIPVPNSGSLPGLATPHVTAAAADSSPGTKTKIEPEGIPKVAVAKKSSDPISSLLSSLVAKGLISATKTESAAPVSSHTAKLPQNEGGAIISSSEPITSASFSAEVAVSTTAEEVSTPEPVAETSNLSQQPAVTEEIKNLIGFEFRPEVIRKFHSIVIDDLFDNFPHRCGTCGLRLKLKEQLDRHLVLHASLNSEQKDAADVTNRWYAHSSDWVAGRTGALMYEAESMEVEEKCIEAGGIPEPMVPADESQCACVLCGELFEDFYDLGKDEWMFKGAVFMNIPCGIPEFSIEIDSGGLVVHANCLSGNSIEDLGLHFHVKKENDA